MNQLCAIMLRAKFSLEFSHRYSKLEFQQARSLWMVRMRHLGYVEATEAILFVFLEMHYYFLPLDIYLIFISRYSKLEFQQARSLWMAGMRHLGDVEATEADYETQFSVMVEQEVERRLFQVSFLFSYFVELLKYGF